MIAVNDFTELLKKQPKNAEVYIYRARAWARLDKYPQAIHDLSISITLNPNNYIPFYYRGCFLRKCLPKKALQDLSVSLLLESSAINVNSYLHRGKCLLHVASSNNAFSILSHFKPLLNNI